MKTAAIQSHKPIIPFFKRFLKEDGGMGEGENFLQEVLPFPHKKLSYLTQSTAERAATVPSAVAVVS